VDYCVRWSEHMLKIDSALRRVKKMEKELETVLGENE
jgi:hypothetical protein